MSYVNLAEVLYHVRRREGERVAVRTCGSVEMLPSRLATVSQPETYEAARLKAAYPVSLADAYCAALARIYDYSVLTGNSEFKALEREIRVHLALTRLR
jgi:predicted nucleic acid-binding protein